MILQKVVVLTSFATVTKLFLLALRDMETIISAWYVVKNGRVKAMKLPEDLLDAIERRSNPIFWIAVMACVCCIAYVVLR